MASYDGSSVDELKKELSALRKAMADENRSVEYEGYSFQRFGFTELQRREAWLIERIRAKEGKRRSRLIRLNADKGL